MPERKLSLVLIALLASACGHNDGAQSSGDLLKARDSGDPAARAADDDSRAGLDPTADPTLDDFLDSECVNGGGSMSSIEVVFDCGSITVHSCKDLSNVVIELEDGSRQRFEGLSSQGGTFSGTGAKQGSRIVGVWVKAGNNKSGDGPGYGERFEAPEQDCTPPPAAGNGGSGGTGGSDDPDKVCGGGGLGGAGGSRGVGGGSGEGGAGGQGGMGGCGSDDPDNVCGGGGLGGAGNGGTPICADDDPNCHVN
jgi:hypothetical protein